MLLMQTAEARILDAWYIASITGPDNWMLPVRTGSFQVVDHIFIFHCHMVTQKLGSSLEIIYLRLQSNVRIANELTVDSVD